MFLFDHYSAIRERNFDNFVTYIEVLGYNNVKDDII